MGKDMEECKGVGMKGDENIAKNGGRDEINDCLPQQTVTANTTIVLPQALDLLAPSSQSVTIDALNLFQSIHG